jgi:hypothetical protein
MSTRREKRLLRSRILQNKISEMRKELQLEFYKKESIIDKEATIGFIILRKVIDFNTSRYWKKSYDCIRKYYPENMIIIIDDNSDYKFIDINYQNNLNNIKIINSEYPNRGEVLPYYYYLHNKFFDIAVIIHDSVFINNYIDFYTNSYKLLWEFEHNWDCPDEEIKIINELKNSNDLIIFYNKKNLWKGCFGGMSVIKHDYLKYLDSFYDIKILLKHIDNREKRMCFERIIACILQLHDEKECLFGNITNFYNKYFNINFDEIESFSHLPIIKIWTGR